MQALVLRNGTAAMFGKRGCAMLFTRPLCVRRIAQELTREEEDQEYPRMRSKVRSNPMHLHPALQLQDQYASYHRTTYQAPNLASFAIAAAAAGLVTALYFELQETQGSWTGEGMKGFRSPYPVNPVPASVPDPNPLRVGLEATMAEHKRLQDELAALSAQGRFRGSASRKKELVKAIRDVEAQQAALLEEAKKQLLRA